MKTLVTSADWPEVETELLNMSNIVRRTRPDIAIQARKVLGNIAKMVTEMSRVEVEIRARRVHTRKLEELAVSANETIEMVHQMMLMEILSS